MFETLELGQSLTKSDFKQQQSELRQQLLTLQRALHDANIATLVIIAGVEGAGKGEVVNILNKWLDTRHIETYAFWDETDEEHERPFAWRFWRRLPMRGSMAIMFGAWYWQPLYQRTRDNCDDAQLESSARQIRELENMLAADGMHVVKIWLHLSRATHTKRMQHRRETQKHIRGLASEGGTDKQYDTFLIAAESLIRYTNTADCPWHLLEAEDKRFRDISVGRILQQSLQNRIVRHQSPPLTETASATSTEHKSILATLDLSQQLAREDYKQQLKKYQKILHQLSWQAYDQQRACVLVFEGWDAAGKGGCIRRLTAAMDARLYRVRSIAAPSDEELAHHYLWRFWRQIPRCGYMTIYDRSWYGRVLVERIEGYASTPEWARAYLEINNFEEQLGEFGTIMIKFWLHISADEQLARFKERQETPWKQHKITDEDWRNREKRDVYINAVTDMLKQTSTTNAHWNLIAAEDKYHARIEVLKKTCDILAQALQHPQGVQP